MRKFKIAFLFLFVLTLGLILRSCLSEPYTYEDYMIKVDSIHIPGTIILHTPFDIEFFGIVGFDGCHSFKTYNQTTTTDNNITIEAWGNYESKGSCPAVLVTLEGQKLNMTFHTPGTYTIKIQEPDNSSIVRQITVN
jgi:hypothetical protein